MKKRFLLFIVLLIFIISITTFFLILNYFDPYSAPILALSLLGATFVLFVSTLSTLILYIIKKVHYRGDVGIYHVKTSFRQGVFLSIFLLGVIALKIFGVSLFLSGIVFGALFIFLELFIQNLANN